MATILPDQQISLNSVYDEIADFFASAPSVEQIAELKLSEASEALLSHLLDLNRTSRLHPEEQTALDEYGVIESLLQMIKMRAIDRVDPVR